MKIKYSGPVYQGHCSYSDCVWIYIGLDIKKAEVARLSLGAKKYPNEKQKLKMLQIQIRQIINGEGAGDANPPFGIDRINKLKISEKWGQEDGTVHKVPASHARGPEFRFLVPCKGSTMEQEKELTGLSED